MDKEDIPCIISNGLLLSRKKTGIIPSAATWMDLENSLLSEVSQKETNTVWYYICGFYKAVQMNLFTKLKQTHRYRKQTSLTKGDGWGDKLGLLT